MSSISLPKPLRLAAAPQRREASASQSAPTITVSAGIQDRSAAENGTTSPDLFWKIIIALAIASLACNAIGMALFGGDWLAAYWDALANWCAAVHCQ